MQNSVQTTKKNQYVLLIHTLLCSLILISIFLNRDGNLLIGRSTYTVSKTDKRSNKKSGTSTLNTPHGGEYGKKKKNIWKRDGAFPDISENSDIDIPDGANDIDAIE